MKKDKKLFNIVIIALSTIIVVLLFLVLFFNNKKEISFSIKEKNIKIKIGETKKINYDLSDDTKIINWTSSNEIIKINENGEAIANGYGKVIVTGTITLDDGNIVDSCTIESFTGEEGITINDINMPEGSLLMKPNSEYELPFTIDPVNAYITSIDYHSGDETIATVENNKIISKNEGSTTISMVVNKKIAKDLIVKVSNKNKENIIVKEIESVTFKESKVNMEMGETKLLSYDVNPSNGFIDIIDWTSSDENVITVSEGEVNAVNVGTATITILINNKISSSIDITVKSSKADIIVDTNPKTTIRIGESTSIKAHINPTNVNEQIVYKSSNPSVIKVENGIVTGINNGTATITLTIGNGKTKIFNINVLPKSGSLTGSANIWGYKSLNSKTPVYADTSFFQKLASSGIGLLQGNNYILNTSDGNFTYDITTNKLSVNNKNIKVRIYYPNGVDLSTTNTLTYMGGRGETNFGGAFTDIKNDPSIIKSGGIVILIAEGNGFSFDGDSGAYATMFVKAIVKQKPGVKNSILGFSDGAHKVMHASRKMKYDRIVVFSGYTDGVDSLDNAKNSEVFFIIAPNDGNYSQAKTALRHMKTSGYTNVTIISNGTDMSKLYDDKFLVITPGTLMKNGHLTENIFRSGMIEYLND